MSKWIVELPDEIKSERKIFYWDWTILDYVPANAKKAVEVKSIAEYDLSAVSGGKLWATEEE